MTYAEFRKLLLLADSMIASCAPKKAEYGRGYHVGIQIHFNSAQPGSLPDHYSIAEIARSNGCRNAAMFMLSLVDIVMVTWGRNRSIAADLLLA